MISFAKEEKNRAQAMNLGWFPCVGFLTLSWPQDRSIGGLRLMEESPVRAAGGCAWITKEAVEIPPYSLGVSQVQPLGFG